jgi:hypothetical protein
MTPVPLIAALALAWIVSSEPPPAAIASQSRESSWTLASRTNHFAFDTSGSMWSKDGGGLRLRAVLPETKSRVLAMKRIPADTFRLDTVVVYGEMKLRDVGVNGAVMIATFGGPEKKTLTGRVTRDLKGTTEWTHFFAMVDVPKEATEIMFGPSLDGGGEIEIRGLKFDVRKAKR